jgi:Fe2+ transport system protein FeoA
MDAYSAGVGAFPLILAAAGERVRVIAVGRGRGIDRKLSDLGLTNGCEVTVVSRDGDGRMVVARDDMRLALGAGIAHRILVARVENDGRWRSASAS